MKTKSKSKSPKDSRMTGPKEKLQMLSGGIYNMNYRDCKRRAIALGMPFPDACAADFNKLHSFIVNSNNKPDPSLIDKYDDWMDKQLEDRGFPKTDPRRSYQLRLGFIGENEEGKVVRKRIKGISKPKKPKREKTQEGIWKGTKKAYTYELASRGFSIERTIRRVLKKFPDAKEKSIKQWYKACKRKQDEEKES